MLRDQEFRQVANRLDQGRETTISRLRRLQVPDPLAQGNRSLEACGRRLQLALQMSDDGIQMWRAKVRRENVSLSAQEEEKLLKTWLSETRPSGFADGWLVANEASALANYHLPSDAVSPTNCKSPLLG